MRVCWVFSRWHYFLFLIMLLFFSCMLFAPHNLIWQTNIFFKYWLKKQFSTNNNKRLWQTIRFSFHSLRLIFIKKICIQVSVWIFLIILFPHYCHSTVSVFRHSNWTAASCRRYTFTTSTSLPHGQEYRLGYLPFPPFNRYRCGCGTHCTCTLAQKHIHTPKALADLLTGNL